MISSHHTTKAYTQGLESAKNTLPYIRKGRILVKNPYASHTRRGKMFSKGFSYGINHWKFLKNVNNN